MKYLYSAIICVVLSGNLVAQDHLSIGKDALAKKQYDKALSSFTLYNKSNSREAVSNYWLGETYRQMERYDSAQYWLDRALDFDDEFEPALASIVYTYGKLRQWDKAQRRYNEAAKYYKKGIIANLMYANVFLESDSLDKAQIYFSKIKEIDEKNVEAYIGLSEVYGRQNVLVLAIDNLRTAVKIQPNDAALRYRLASTILKQRSLNKQQIEEVLEQLQKSIELDPSNLSAIFDAANTLYRIGYYAEAAGFFKKYYQLKNDNAEVLEKYAISLYKARAYNDAIPILEEAIKANKKSFELKPMLAHSYYVAKEYKKSVDYYKSIPVDSLAVDDFYRIGYASFQLKDTSNAVKNLEKSLSLDPTNTDAAGTLAYIFLTQKNYLKAVANYEILLKKDPDNFVSLFYSGFSHSVLGNIDTAKNYFKRCVELRPNYVPARQYLANMYSLQDSSDLGKEQYLIVIDQSDSLKKAEPKKAEQHNKVIISSYRALAIFEYKKTNIPGAIDYLLKAVDLETKDGKDASLHLFLAQMYAVRSGDKELSAEEGRAFRAKSIEEYKLVLKLDPKNETAKKELKAMQG